MNRNDFRCLRRGININTLSAEEVKYLQPYHHEGKKHDRALILIHGFSSSPAVFRYLVDAMPQYDCIHAPLLPGHGESLDAFANCNEQQWVDAVNDCYDTLASQYKKIDVLGLSLGGLLAYQLAQQRPVNHLFCLAPAMHLHLSPLNAHSALALARFLNRLKFSRIRNNAGTILSDQYYEITYRQLAIPAIIALLTLVTEFEFSPPSCPTDVFLGRHDNVVNSKQVAALFEGCENVNVHWLENSAHVVTIDNDLAQIIELVRRSGASP